MFKNDKNWHKIEGYYPRYNRVDLNVKVEERLTNIDGSNIRYDKYTPRLESDITVVILHGVGGNGRLLSFIAVPLVKNGYNVICPDLPGYGYSEVKGSLDYSTWIKVSENIVKSELDKGQRVYVFGLSAGGMLAYNVVCNLKQVKGLIITNILDNRIQEVKDCSAKNKFYSRIGLDILSKLPRSIRKFRLPVKLVVNMRAIVNNDDLLELMINDPVGAGSTIPLDFLLSMMNHKPHIEPEDFDVCPVLLLHPEFDRWTPVHISRMFYDLISAPKKLVLLKNAGHFPIEEPGVKQIEEECIEFISHGILGKP